jgi:Icc protein
MPHEIYGFKWNDRAVHAVWVTDLHLSFCTDAVLAAFYTALETERPAVVFVTGDTGESWNVFDFVSELERTTGARVYYVLGNHDYYGSSIDKVRERARTTERWLPGLGPIALTETTTLVGIDGWGDARCGNRESRIRLTDWQAIRDLDMLMHCPSQQRVAVLESLGVREGKDLRAKLAKVDARELIVLTHVPPFAEACWYEGKQSSPDWLPWFSCIAVGEVLRRYARAHPQTNVTVLCGHTHGRGEYRAEPNLLVRTGGWAPGEQSYGNPIVQASWTLT